VPPVIAATLPFNCMMSPVFNSFGAARYAIAKG